MKDELARISKGLSDKNIPHCFFVFDSDKGEYEYFAFLSDADVSTIMEQLAIDYGADMIETVFGR